jgi:DHA1 family inner membrane transport protein
MFTRKEKIFLFLLSVIQFSHIVDFMILMPLQPKLERIFSLTPTQFSWLVSSYTFAAGASGILSSLFMDRFDRKKSLLFFFAGFVVGTFCCAFAPNYIFLLWARIITGAFGGVLGSLVLAITGDLIPSERRGQAIGVVMSGFSAASIFGVPFSLKLADHFDWHFPFIFLGLLGLILIPATVFFLPTVSEHLAKQKSENPLLRWIHLVKENGPQKALIFMLLLTMGQFLLIPFISPSLVTNAGMKESDLFLVYLVGGVFSLIASPLSGKLADRMGKHRVFLGGIISSLLPILLISHMGPNSLFGVLLVVAIFFTTVTFRFVPAMAMITGSVTLQHRGTFMGIVSAAQNFSAAIGSTIAGLIVTKADTGQLINYNYCGYLAVITALFAIYFSFKLKVID